MEKKDLKLALCLICITFYFRIIRQFAGSGKGSKHKSLCPSLRSHNGYILHNHPMIPKSEMGIGSMSFFSFLFKLNCIFISE
jgi:hypothetical protein